MEVEWSSTVGEVSMRLEGMDWGCVAGGEEADFEEEVRRDLGGRESSRDVGLDLRLDVGVGSRDRFWW